MPIPQSEFDRANAVLHARAALLVRDTPSFPFLVAVAQQLGGKWGLNGKRGNRTDPSRDVLTYLDGGVVHLYDVIGDAWDPATGKGANTLGSVGGEGETHPNGEGGVWLDPFAFPSPITLPPPPPPPPTPVPVPTPPPPPAPPLDLSPIVAGLAVLATAIASLGEAHKALSEEVRKPRILEARGTTRFIGDISITGTLK